MYIENIYSLFRKNRNSNPNPNPKLFNPTPNPIQIKIIKYNKYKKKSL